MLTCVGEDIRSKKAGHYITIHDKLVLKLHMMIAVLFVCSFSLFLYIRFSNHSLNETKLAKIFTAQSKLREEKVGKKITLIIRDREGYRIRFV